MEFGHVCCVVLRCVGFVLDLCWICAGFVLDLCWQHKRGNVAGAVEFGHLCCVVLELCWICVRNTNAETWQALWNFVIFGHLCWRPSLAFLILKGARHPLNGGGQWCPSSIIVWHTPLLQAHAELLHHLVYSPLSFDSWVNDSRRPLPEVQVNFGGGG